MLCGHIRGIYITLYGRRHVRSTFQFRVGFSGCFNIIITGEKKMHKKSEKKDGGGGTQRDYHHIAPRNDPPLSLYRVKKGF